MSSGVSAILAFNIDGYINPYIRKAPISSLPKPISRFLGHRDQATKDAPNLLIWTWAFIGAFTGLITVGALTKYTPGLQQYHPPVIIASLGAAAVLDYNTINTPLAQPRNAFLGQTISALVGVCITKLFRLSPDFQDLQWVAGALACGTASFAMGLTNTIHPPGGATAVLAATNTQVTALGWMYIPCVMMDTAIMLAVALVVNNIQRQYPKYWWTAEELPRRQVVDLKKGRVDGEPERTLRTEG